MGRNSNFGMYNFIRQLNFPFETSGLHQKQFGQTMYFDDYGEGAWLGLFGGAVEFSAANPSSNINLHNDALLPLSGLSQGAFPFGEHFIFLVSKTKEGAPHFKIV